MNHWSQKSTIGNGKFITEFLNTSPESTSSGSQPTPTHRGERITLDRELQVAFQRLTLGMVGSRPRAQLETFTETTDQNALRWLRKFSRERGFDHQNDPMAPSEWLEEFDILLAREAATSADKDPVIKELLSDQGINNATDEQVETLKEMFLKRFEPIEEEDTRNPTPDIQTLKQEKDEPVEKYYRRAHDLLIATGGHDRSLLNNTNGQMSAAVLSLLNLTIDRFVSGLADPMLRLRMLRHVGESLSTRTLKSVFLQTEMETRLMKVWKQECTSEHTRPTGS